MFIEPDRSIRIHRSIMNDAYFIDVKDFCNDMVEACKGWLQKVETTPLFQTNSIKFIMRYPQGLKPYVSGVPVIG